MYINARNICGRDSTVGDARVGDARVGDARVGDVTVGDVTAGDATAGDATVGDARVGDARVEEAPGKPKRRPEARARPGATWLSSLFFFKCCVTRRTGPTRTRSQRRFKLVNGDETNRTAVSSRNSQE